MSVRLSLNAKTYRNTGTYDSPIWVEMVNIKDATLEDSMDETEVTRRASGGVKEYEPTLRGISFDFNAPNVEGDAELIAVRTAYATRAPIELAVMDGPITAPGSNGLRFEAKVFKNTRNESLSDAQMKDFTFKPCCSENPTTELTIE